MNSQDADPTFASLLPVVHRTDYSPLRHCVATDEEPPQVMTQHTTAKLRTPATESRQRAITAARELLEQDGAKALNMAAIAQRSGVNRTVLYRHYGGVHDVVAELIEESAHRQAEGAAAWFRDPAAVGRREDVYPNALAGARVFKPGARLMCAILDAAGDDAALRNLWHERFVQPRIDAAVAAIKRDQAAGTVRASLDPEPTAIALQTMGIELALQILGREDGTPEAQARLVAPIWEAVLFGPPHDGGPDGRPEAPLE